MKAGKKRPLQELRFHQVHMRLVDDIIPGMKSLYKKRILILVSLLFAAVLSYYTVEVLVARANTQRIVNDCLESEQVKITVKDLSDRQLDILLKIEDPNFYNHHGVDFTTPGAGWTTITQALAKRFYFDNFEQGLMKIKQTLCARLALDPLVSKDTQLTIFLNIMYFGNDVYGLHDAANYYFDKDVGELEDDEYISLIASLISPNELNIKEHPQENYQRVQRIKKVLSGAYTPDGLFDITYEGADKI